MWNEKIIKIIPSALFLFCLLECFEMVLIINDLNKLKKLEALFEENLKLLKTITILSNEHLQYMEHFKDKKIKIK